jgi:hypothetical protein
MPRQAGDCVERRRKTHFDPHRSLPLLSSIRWQAAQNPHGGNQPRRRRSNQRAPKASSPSISSLTATGNRISTCFGICRALATRARAKFHCELQKLRKPGVADVTTPGVPLPTLTQELGHEPLAATEDYPVHVKKAETKKAVVDADSFPSPRPRAQDCKDEY